MRNTEHIVSESIMINAPATAVFDIVADPHQHSRIDGSGSVKGLIVGPSRLTDGAKFGVRMKLFGAPYKITNTVVEFEQDQRIAWRHFGGHRWRYTIEPVGQGQVKVTESFDYSRYNGWQSTLLEVAQFPRRNRQGIKSTLANLKSAAEADAH